MIDRNNKLEIFENFIIDRNLPKYKKSEKVKLTNSIISEEEMDTNTFAMVSVPNAINNGFSFNGEVNDNPIKKWFSFFKKKRIEKEKTITILNFFNSLATSLNDLKLLQDIATHYEQAILNATKAGQISLVERLKFQLESAKSETQLINLGLNKYFTETQIVDFYKKTSADKNLKLTWIRHFIKPIPSKILNIKENLDKQFIFDNYVILHYDPYNNATDLSKQEKEEIKKREKDPILFGVMKDSRRLYYIADWIDEYCNLTLDILVEELGENVNEVNNEKVKTYLDTGIRTEINKLPSKSRKKNYKKDAML